MFVCFEQETEKGAYANTDHYVAHVTVTKDQKNVLVVTDRSVSLCDSKSQTLVNGSVLE